MKQFTYDYLIIGQGIAGSVLAMTLQEQGKSIFVIDSAAPNTSSNVAAGIMNPITGKRMTVSWMANTFFPKAMDFYDRMEQVLNTSFLSKHPILRVFGSIGEQNDWSAKWQQDRYKSFVKKDVENNSGLNDVPSNYGCMEVSGGGRLETKSFIKAVRNKLIAENRFEEAEVRMNDLLKTSNGVEVAQKRAKQVVFCTGLDIENWGFLPFTPMKGEVLEVESQTLNADKTIVGSCFLSPIAQSRYYAGATYDWRNINLDKTDRGREEILEKLANFTTSDFKVVSHQVGVRPAVKDRRPLIGRHPEYTDVYLFSGLGSKGVSMAPHLATCLIDFIEKEVVLDKDMDLSRFVS